MHDDDQMKAVKEALHASKAPSTVVCREDEQRRVLEFVKACTEQKKAGSLYICGCHRLGSHCRWRKLDNKAQDRAKQVINLVSLSYGLVNLYINRLRLCFLRSNNHLAQR
ncbi:hypothetical protein Bca52824_049690 [Brassica carinata]|uniref:Uncharacterized protein n=1 Tax=Brassica carinata TaxID=52824 RepID=A0A8X7UUD3_BRACI|nr:hypothetical protein Bca52824_049690 [Brassica carinata]